MPGAPALTVPPALMAAATTTVTSLPRFSPAGGFASTTFSPLTSCDCCPYLNSLGKFSTMRAHLSRTFYTHVCVCVGFSRIRPPFFKYFMSLDNRAKTIDSAAASCGFYQSYSAYVVFNCLKCQNCRRNVCDGIIRSHVANHRQRRLAPEIMHLLR